MSIKKTSFAALLASTVIAASAMAASVTITGNGSTIIINKNGGFDGVDGADREAVFVAAAQVWADILVSNVDIVIDAEFSPALLCNASSATLGSAGPQNTYFPSGAENIGLANNTWYPTALINAHNGSDMFAGSADINAQFNSDIGDADCLANSGWYYGMDGNTPAGYINFYEVVLHELGHGLGILSLVYSDGSYPNSTVDIFSTFLRDQGMAADWSSMSNAERALSIENDGNLVWNGAEVTALSGNLTNGVNGGYVQMYAPGTYENGSSVSHFDTALTPNELMEPQYTGDSSHDHSEALLKDIGWTLYQAANDVPQITGQSALSVDEDNSLTLAVSHLTVVDNDDSSFTLTVNSGTNYAVSGNSITPDSDYNGTLTVPVFVNDSQDDSAVYSLTVTVNSVNDAPVITAQSALLTAEGAALELSVSDLTIVDPDDSSFTLNVGSGSDYTVSGSTVTPAVGFNGTLTVPVTVNDGETDSAEFNVSITVTEVNDIPVIAAQSTLAINEDQSLTLFTSDITISDSDDSAFTLTVNSGNHYSVSGTTVTPDTDFHGSLTVPVTVNDGHAESTAFDLIVTVNPVNDAPILNGIPDTEVLFTDTYSATFSASDVDHSSLIYSVVSNHTWLSMSSDGVLSGSPTQSDIGSQSVTVMVSDGELMDEISFNLSVIDSMYADLSAAIEVSDPYVLNDEVSTATVSVTNLGPANSASGSVDITIAGATAASTTDSACTLTGSHKWRCSFNTFTNVVAFEFSTSSHADGVITMTAQTTGTLTDIELDNNWADSTVVIDALPSEPDNALSFAGGANSQAAAVLQSNAEAVLLLANDLAASEQQLTFDDAFSSVSAVSDFSVNLDANAIVVEDFNGDTLPDVVFAADSGSLFYPQRDNGTWVSAVTVDTANAKAAVTADFNNDEHPDLFFATDTSNRLYLNDGHGQFVLSQSLGSSLSTDVAIIDYNADGWPDLIVTNADDDDYVYLNNGADQSSGVFSEIAIPIGSVLTQSSAVVVADFNGDDIANDFAVARVTADGASSLSAYHLNGNVASELFSLDAGDLESLDAGYFDQDDNLNLVALNSDGVVFIWRVVNGLADRVQTFQHVGANAVYFGDIDLDGDADLTVLSDADSASVLYVSQTADPETTDNLTSENTNSTDETETNTAGSSASESEQDTTPAPEITVSGSLSWLMSLCSFVLLFRRGYHSTF